MSFDTAIKFTLAHEGGYVNDPQDPGGETNYGITKKVWDNYAQRINLPPTPLKDIPLEEALFFYFSNYWKAAKCDELVEPLDMVVFDTAVNMGVPKAEQFLAETTDWEQFLNLRIKRYEFIINRDPKLSKFEKGWYNRVRDLRKECEAWQERQLKKRQLGILNS